ncbi:chemotaxis protein CheW [Haloterrigena alkaliphila]|uniref:Chemotaxis protein CheW n=1 Tax=Haloterrigena alkaliphila TaxID=2816475 RepID=A0A8A2VD00_9EURY|nr:chemotaxis protein CheW [Haloterrigena alkaliphila]QSW98105.1 chemotaxis protein CheW [Haloterrigena alkaliphila]
MAPDLSEKLLGIDIDDADDGQRGNADGTDEDQEELAQFLFVALGAQRFAVPVAAVRTLAEVPDGLTRVPRAPPAIEGMMDLRGEITAVIDPLVHFPNIAPEERTGSQRLLVLDRPADQQSAALRVDEVLGVETVPERDVLDETTVADGPLSGDALEHPLIVALVEQEHERHQPVATPNRRAEVGLETDAEHDAGGTALSGPSGALGDATADVGQQFALEGEESGAADETTGGDDPSGGDPTGADGSEPTREVVVEATPVIDVDTLLLASGQRE